MTKRILSVITFVAVVAVAGWNYNQNTIELSELTLNNVEALASGEGDGMTDCPNGCLTPAGVCFCYGYHPFEEARK
ncbi:MAG: NVEALA domain-containing protein [Parabacteroides sp.]|nr:NVEALA domain-containing protein [Parabacteroides sp.]